MMCVSPPTEPRGSVYSQVRPSSRRSVCVSPSLAPSGIRNFLCSGSKVPMAAESGCAELDDASVHGNVAARRAGRHGAPSGQAGAYPLAAS
eukprot:6089361-Prymnesium_polylepis.1